MRIWHKDLIDVLPTPQLRGQWKELSEMRTRIIKNGTPNHLLVNRMLEYSVIHYKRYVTKIYIEMLNRGLKPRKKQFEKLIGFNDGFHKWFKIPKDNGLVLTPLYEEWHNDRYLRQCLLNLQEKHDCACTTNSKMKISDEEWVKIIEKYIFMD